MVIELIDRKMRSFAMWLVWNGPPLGRFAVPLFDYAMRQKGKPRSTGTRLNEGD